MKELINIIAELKAPKGQYNSFGKYKYRSCEDILEAVKPLLSKYGCLLFISDEIRELQVPYDYTSQVTEKGVTTETHYNGSRVYIEATATIVLPDGQTVSVKGIAREEVAKKGMDAAQITGAASSYARKYALNGLFCIDDTKDADATNTHGKELPAQQPTPTPQPSPTATYQMAISALKACTTAAETIQVCKTWETRLGDQVDAFKNECRAMYNKLSKAS